MLDTLQSYQMYNPLDNKNVFLDRLIKANLSAFKEVIKMGETVMEIFLETIEENGWLDNRFEADKKAIAKDMLLDGESVEKVAKWMRLPISTVETLLQE